MRSIVYVIMPVGSDVMHPARRAAIEKGVGVAGYVPISQTSGQVATTRSVLPKPYMSVSSLLPRRGPVFTSLQGANEFCSMNPSTRYRRWFRRPSFPRGFEGSTNHTLASLCYSSRVVKPALTSR